jgi:hypothetical protein
VFTIGDCAVSWRATLQPVIAQFTTKVECMTITEACRESIWLKGSYTELCGDDACVNLFYDKVLYTLLNFKCSMRGASTLMSSTIM